MPVLRKTINLSLSGNALVAVDSVTLAVTTDAGVKGEDGAVMLHCTIPVDWQDITTKLQVIASDGAFDESVAAVGGIIDMPLLQGVTVKGALTIRLVGSTPTALKKSLDLQTLKIAESDVESDLISHVYPYTVRTITGTGGATVTRTGNETLNIDVLGTGGDMLRSTYVKGIKTNVDTVDVSLVAKEAQAGSALATQIAAKMPTTTFVIGDKTNVNTVDVALVAKEAQAGSTLDSVLKTGWVSATETWVYASGNTITVPTGATSKYQKGDRIMFTQNSLIYYGVILSVLNTLITLIPNSDYTIVNSAITLNYYSHELNPMGFPTYFSWVPTITAGTGTPTSVSASIKYSVCGKLITVTGNINVINKGTATGLIVATLPVNAVLSSMAAAQEVASTGFSGTGYIPTGSGSINITNYTYGTYWANTYVVVFSVSYFF